MFITTLFTIAKMCKQPKCPLKVKQIKKRSLMMLLICRTLKMIQMKSKNRNSLTDIEKELMVTRGEGRKREEIRSFGLTYTHYYIQNWRRKWQPTPVFLPGEFQGWGSLVGCHL